ncbi:hypothetical protein TGVAND_247570 [Toxoplasma gondii VAND]|uniref:Uncharacterized protein n=1 Tax=Toxoplasma gondii VAND TaxID=933077 RepID=A0A086QI76_TOXGO|nr:hypothetical protein TGVAND_247570 [Toxoplasma gondii VAND]
MSSSCEAHNQSVASLGCSSRSTRSMPHVGFSGRSSSGPRNHYFLTLHTRTERSKSCLQSACSSRSPSATAVSTTPDKEPGNGHHVADYSHVSSPKCISRSRQLSGFSALDCDVLQKARILCARPKSDMRERESLLLADKVLCPSPHPPAIRALRNETFKENTPRMQGLSSASVVCSTEHVNPVMGPAYGPQRNLVFQNPRRANTSHGQRTYVGACNASFSFCCASSVGNSTKGTDTAGFPGEAACGKDVSPLEAWETEEVRAACMGLLKQWAPFQERRPPNDFTYTIPLEFLQPLAEFVENDCAGIGKVPVRLIKDAVQLKEEHEKTVAAAQAQTQADVAAAGHLVPTSHFGSQGRGNHSAGGTRGKAGKTASETSSEGGHSAGGNRGCLARKAAGGVVSSTTGTVPSPSAGSVAKEKTVAGLGILPAKDGASGLTQGMPLASPSPDMTAAQVLDWVLHRPWVERDEHLIEQALEKFYVDAQTRLTQGKPAEATKMATLAIRLSRILDERQAAKARAVADNPSTMRMFKERKMDLFW